MTGGTGLHRFDLPFAHGFFAELKLRRLGGRFPRQVGDLVLGPQLQFRMTMAFQAEGHAERFGVINLIHLVNAPVTFHAADAAVDVNRVIKIRKIGNFMDLNPLDGLAGGGAFTNQRQARIVLEHLRMAIHASGRRGDIREPGFLHARMAIPAIHPELPGVHRVGERHGLDRLIADAGVFGCEIIPHPGRHGGADKKHSDDNHQRQPVGPLWENR